MLASVNLKERSNPLKTKYRQLRGRLESSYGLIQYKFTSKFHKVENRGAEAKLVSKGTLENSAASYFKIPKLKLIINLPNRFSLFNKIIDSFEYSVDWANGRFRGVVKQIIVRDGIIIEKAFISPKGNLIIVKDFRRILLKKLYSTSFYKR